MYITLKVSPRFKKNSNISINRQFQDKGTIDLKGGFRGFKSNCVIVLLCHHKQRKCFSQKKNTFPRDDGTKKNCSL